ncbi:MAG: type II toxin-antitoxin system antitoxin SocA domain-containing protein [Pseudomonadota bacterium]
MPKDARAVANFILNEARKDSKSLTPMQMVKLVYLAHGWFMAWHDDALIDEDVQAWQYGPVIRSVYNAFKQYGREPIERPTYGDYDLVIDIGLVNEDDELINPKPVSADFSDDEQTTIRAVLGGYGDLNGLQLSALTHREGTPWHDVYRAGERDQVIHTEVIRKHFKQLDQRNRKLLERPA